MSEIRVDTISEKTSANGVTIDGLTIKDGNIIGDVALAGTTPTFTIGDAGAEDAALIFDGNAQDFYVALDDSADDLVIGLGNTIGTTPIMSFDENKDVVIHDGGLSITTADNTNTLTLISTDTDASYGPNIEMSRPVTGTTNDLLGRIDFSGQDAAGNTHNYFSIEAIIDDATSGAEFGRMLMRTEVNGATKNMIDMNGAEIVFNEDSVDYDFRVESNALTHAFFIDGGTDHVSMGNSSTSLYTLDVKQNADFTGSSSDTANEAPLRVWSTHSNGRGAIAIGGNNNNGVFNKGANDLVIQGYNSVTFDVSTTNDDKFGTKTERFRISSSGKLATGAETDPDVDAGGLTLQHNAEDNNVLTFKNSDVAHSMTSIAEADTYGFFKKSGSNDGGIQMVSMNDNGNVALQILGISNGGEDTGKGTGDHGCVRIDAASRSGTSLGSQGSNVNMVTICNNNTVRFIFDAEGDFHADSGSTTFDAYQDAQLVRAYDLSHGKGVIASKFDKFVQYNASDLTDAGLVGKVNNEYNEDGTKANPLINMSGFMRLHNGAIWQQYEKHQKLASAFYKLAEKTIGKEEADKLLTEEEIQLLN
ncbi:hypothetical protein N8Y98_02805 [Pelagibacterales bacterium]|nr:hypothetical protein [Pelagibacterales bacterium]